MIRGQLSNKRVIPIKEFDISHVYVHKCPLLYIPLLFYQVLETASADTELASDETPPEFIQDEEL